VILHRKHIWLFVILNLSALLTYAAQNSKVTCFWRPTAFNGEFRVNGHYRYQEGISNGIYNVQKNPLIGGAVLFNSSSYLWHPNFVILNVGAEYSPMKNQTDYLVVPDQSEVNTIKKFDVNATFFKQKPISVGLFTNYNECYTNRENLSNLKLTSFNWGGNLVFTNKVLPFQAGYRNGHWKEYEISTGRTFLTHQTNLQADVNKSFSSRDKNEIRYSHNNFYRKDDNFAPVNNISDNIDIINRFDFDKKQNYTFNSFITGINQKGNDAYSRIQASEAVNLKLPANFRLMGTYNYFHNVRKNQKSIQNNFGANLGYTLYKSLEINVYYEDNSLSHTFYKETNKKIGLDLRYSKKIPTGNIFLTYSSFRQRQKRVSDITRLQVFSEEHLLVDGQIVLLRNAYVDTATIVVKDVTGTIFYQKGLDFILISRNNYLEIQRIPGGQITNNTMVYLDYTYMPPGTYQFDATYRQFTANVILFNNLVEVYFKYAKQNYSNLVSEEYLTLNYFTQIINGCRLEYKAVSGGIEYESYKSTIIPYHLLRYYLVLQGSIHEKVLYSLNANVRSYRMMDDNSYQKYYDLTGNIAYSFSPRSKLNLEFGYRKQVGNEIDLDLLTGKAEYTTVYRQMFFTVGMQVYQRIYLNEKTNFIGGYFEIIRKFSWNRN
jgi:hypothetical protein